MFLFGPFLKTFRMKTNSPFLLLLIFLYSAFFDSTPAQAAPPQLKVVGNQIVTASGGCTVRLTGVNLDSLEWEAQPGDGPSGGDGVLTQLQEAVKYWNVNCVRIPLDQDWWDGNAQTTPNNRGSTSQSGYQSFVDSLVAFCNTNNIYCDLDLQWSGDGSTGTATEQYSMPDENSLVFWASVAARYANNTSVIFDTFNEPYPTSWSVWLDGGTTAEGFTTPGLQAIVNKIRATTASASSTLASGTNAENVCIVGGQQYSYYYVGMSPVVDVTGGNGIVYSAHIYNNKGTNTAAGWESNIEPALTYGPVFIEEFGNSANTTDGGTFVNSVITFMNGTNDKNYIYGGMAWDMDIQATPLLLSDWSSTLSAPVSTGTTGWVLTSYEGQSVYGWLKGLTYPTCSSSGATPTFTFTPTSTFTKTSTPSFTSTPTNTSTSTATLTRTNSPTPTPSNTPTSTASKTVTPTVTNTTTSTATLTKTATATSTPSFTTTNTPVSTATQTATATATRTASATATNTPSNSPTNTSSFTPTQTGTNTFTYTSTGTTTSTPVNTSTLTATRTSTATATNTSSNSPTFTLSTTPSSTATNTPVNTRTQTVTATATGTATATVTNTVSNSPTNTSSLTPTGSATNSPTRTSTETATYTLVNTGTPTSTSTSTVTGSATNTPTQTSSNSPTSTPSVTLTGTPTNTFAETATNTATSTPTGTATSTSTNTSTSTVTNTATKTVTNTVTNSSTNTITNTVTNTPTNTPTQTSSNSPTSTPSVTLTGTPTNTFAETATKTASNTPSNTVTSTTSFTPTSTSSLTATSTASYSPTKTQIYTTTSTTTSTATLTLTITPTFSPTPVTVAASQGSNPPGNSTQVQGASGVTIQQIQMNNPSGGAVTITSITIFETGVPPAGITSLDLFANGTLIGTASFNGSTATFNFNSVIPGDNGAVTYEVTVNFSPGSSTGSYEFSATGAAGSNGEALLFSGIPVAGATVTLAAATATETPTSTTTPVATGTFTSLPTATTTKTATPSAKPTVVVYPNPATGGTVQLNPDLTSESNVSIEIFTIAFRKVNTLNYSNIQPGESVPIPLSDSWGTPLASGLYYVVVQTNQGRSVVKLLILR